MLFEPIKSSAAFARGDERFEDAPLVDSVRRQEFGMPLHADGEAMAGAFDGFDDSVWRDGRRNESAAEASDCLMVGCVYFNRSSAKDCAEPGVVGDLHPMTAMIFFLALLVLGGAGDLVGDILIQRTAENDVERLGAAADAENWQVVF